MNENNSKNIVLAVSGGIAAYKAADLVRRLLKRGCKVRVAMTDAAMEFVTPLTFQALSGYPVHTRLLDRDEENAMGHINLARWADALIIAPATANTIAGIGHGFADDLIGALCLAAECPVYMAPAMNQAMWRKPITQSNIEKCKDLGIVVIGPDCGDQACGETGFGRMSEPEVIANRILQEDEQGRMQGKRVLITAGPTREPLDPVRYISNRSSGKMGYAIAQAARNEGAQVVLISGPSTLPPPASVEVVHIETAAQMHAEVMGRTAQADVFIAAAAVADYTPAETKSKKIKKKDGEMTIVLSKTRDILADVASLANSRPFTVGFAAETHDLEHYARDKLLRKNLDMVAANWIGREQGGFDSDRNALEIYWHGGGHSLPMADKFVLAQQLIGIIAEKMHERNPTKSN
ncbi:MAG: bifunctional phosphopantothenoylcysteine decarboxylase/phosphopantothenate--cysteine ligase CoaBC [Gammaproteobacteria bacterium]